MRGKNPISSHKGYEQIMQGRRVAASKGLRPNFTGTGLRVDLCGCGSCDCDMDGGSDYHGKSEYFNDLSGRVSR
jgi:hypothetical protein